MDNSTRAGPAPARTLDRRILALALPTFPALVSEPMLLLAGSAVVGHLGTAPLAVTLGPPGSPERLDPHRRLTAHDLYRHAWLIKFCRTRHTRLLR